jgi:hypothetical protein
VISLRARSAQDKRWTYPFVRPWDGKYGRRGCDERDEKGREVHYCAKKNGDGDEVRRYKE